MSAQVLYRAKQTTPPHVNHEVNTAEKLDETQNETAHTDNLNLYLTFTQNETLATPMKLE